MKVGRLTPQQRPDDIDPLADRARRLATIDPELGKSRNPGANTKDGAPVRIATRLLRETSTLQQGRHRGIAKQQKAESHLALLERSVLVKRHRLVSEIFAGAKKQALSKRRRLLSPTAAPYPSRTWFCRRHRHRICARRSACRRRRCGKRRGRRAPSSPRRRL